jgi:hypothetical protein
MKRLCILTIVIILAFPLLTSAAQVKGYWRDSNGDGLKDTFVQPYQRTNPNNTVRDNYNYPGNYNPNSGNYSTGNPYTYEQSNQFKSKSYKW